MKWLIYKHTSPSGKIYIGQTMKTTSERWRNGLGYEHSPKINKAIQKYGWENIIHEIIEDNITTQQKANEREIFWINYYNSFYFGYNCTKGGDSREHLTKPIYKISKNLSIIKEYFSANEAAIELNTSPANIRHCLNNEKITCKNFYWCYKDEWVEGWHPKCNNLIVPVFKIDAITLEIKDWYSSIDKAEKLNYISGISQCCQRRTAKCGGYHWCYEKDYNDNWVPPKFAWKRKEAVYCIETGKKYSTALEAQYDVGVKADKIYKCCRKKYGYNSAGKYHWCYLKDQNTFQIKTDDDCSPVVCINTGKHYKSIADASREYDIIAENIQKCCTNKRKTAGKLTWCYEKEYNIGLKPNKQKERELLCVETGIVYPSVIEASRQTNIARGSITSYLCGKRHQKTAGGYHWEYVE